MVYKIERREIMKKNIYLDHAGTTYVKKEVLKEMLPYFTEKFGNPSSVYKLGQENKKAVEHAREQVAHVLNANKNEIYFTSCGSEADNWALKGIAFANKTKGNHIITSKIEHHAILNTCKWLEENGFEVTYLSVDKDGVINLEELKKSIKNKTILISIMYANNEIGTIQPIEKISQIAKEKNIYFHTDAVQAVGNLKIDVKELGIDLLSLSGHKFYGPKGVGALYIKNGVKIDNFIHGGGQESKKRAGTENVAGIVGLGKAIELSYKNLYIYNKKMIELREKMIKEIIKKIPNAKLNGHRTQRLPGNVNIAFKDIEGESLLLMLNMKGIAASSGSACSSGANQPSHVLKAIGLSDVEAHGTLRFTIGAENTEKEIDYVLNELVQAIEKLREIRNKK